MPAKYTNIVYNLCFNFSNGGESWEWMHQQTNQLFYRFRFVLAGILAISLLVLISVIVTITGSGSVLAKSNSSVSVSNIDTSDSPNVITAGAYNLGEGAKRVSLLAGISVYRACHSISIATAQTGKSIVHGGAITVRGIGSGTAFVANGIGSGTAFVAHGASSGVMFTVHLPGKTVGAIANGDNVTAIIQPVDYNPVPVIDTKLAPALVARLNAQAQLDQQKNAELQAAQLAANQALDGVIVAGDPSRGGYPSDWDYPTRQDSRLDSWGMYNRECVSYAAWKVHQAYGNMPYWGGVGNANQWVGNAKAAGIPTSSVPRVKSVAISMKGYYGHAMWVEAVKGDMIYVSQYNYDLHGHYGEMWVSSSSLTYIYFK